MNNNETSVKLVDTAPNYSEIRTDYNVKSNEYLKKLFSVFPKEDNTKILDTNNPLAFLNILDVIDKPYAHSNNLDKLPNNDIIEAFAKANELYLQAIDARHQHSQKMLNSKRGENIIINSIYKIGSFIEIATDNLKISGGVIEDKRALLDIIKLMGQEIKMLNESTKHSTRIAVNKEKSLETAMNC